MKKIMISILCILAIILVLIYTKYLAYKTEQGKIKEQNIEYEEYLDKKILGVELASLINKAVDNNKKNEVQKDEQGFYIKDDTNSIKIEIKITDNDTLYQMETLYGGGMVVFAQYYNSIYFECTKIEYNKLGKVAYMLFEQKTD